MSSFYEILFEKLIIKESLIFEDIEEKDLTKMSGII
jgi:hypothetical protein